MIENNYYDAYKLSKIGGKEPENETFSNTDGSFDRSNDGCSEPECIGG